MNTNVLKGKKKYLFLKETNGHSLITHTKESNITLKTDNLEKRYNKYFDKLLFVIFPDKEVVCKDFLPDGIICKFRHWVDIYKGFFNKNIIDGDTILDENDYYKTDTHMNNRGGLKIYKKIIEYLNKKFNVNISCKKYNIIESNIDSLTKLSIGLGDLTWDSNKGDLVVDTNDTYYTIKPCIKFYAERYNNNDNYQLLDYELNNNSENYVNKIVTWDCISKNLLYKKNKSYFIDKKALIFYDSFLLSTVKLYENIFKEIYLVKNIFKENIIKNIKPDFIIEARVERFLFA